MRWLKNSPFVPVIGIVFILSLFALGLWYQSRVPSDTFDSVIFDSVIIVSPSGVKTELRANKIIFNTTWGGQTVIQLLYHDGTDDYVIVPEGWLFMDNPEDGYRD